ncbi:neural proliferation differentiation and control protein 1a [Plectropomus leopardus]|uniref:neural proliferation differentiation and control protein 1a n=1 Tax=Plectropomus leopardus TaxID=160734 RepID=UPI001C4B45F3|nr:neural proliferation differentiation and control protein 1a [Plectropomus leopardus]
MLLLSSPGNGRLRRASLLLVAAVLLCVVPVGASLPAHSRCLLDCASEGREFCRAGTTHCGPCLFPLVENEEGRCVRRKRHHQHDKVAFYSALDEEIDYLHSVIEKQQVSEIKSPGKQSKPLAAGTSQTDVKKSKTDASKSKQKSQSRQSAEALNATTEAQHTPTPEARATGVVGRVGPIAVPTSKNDKIIVIMISVCVALGTLAVILASVCFVKVQKDSRLAQKVDYPAFKGTGMPAATTNGTSVGDKTLAQSAQMYHYQHQKQQMLSMGNNKPEQKVPDTEVTSDEEEVGGDFTVYECPGLAPTGEMEVKNPLFDDSTLHYQGNHK